VAFVNRQGQEKQNETAGQGQLVDFDPDDPTVVKVHYDLAAWTFDQRAELSEALADADIPHAWDGEELVVPELVEEQTDALFERLESELGPFPVVLEDDAESTEFGLDEWTEVDRDVLTGALIESEIPFRWEGTTVVVASDAEDVVDDLLDAIEAGELLGADEDSPQPPEGALSTIFLTADRLRRDPSDAAARRTFIELQPKLDASHPPYAFAPRTWSRAVGDVEALVAAIGVEAGDDRADGERSEVEAVATRLRDLLRPYV
jgi:hypothetical protein